MPGTALISDARGAGGAPARLLRRLRLHRDAEQECAAFHKRTGRIIKLLTVQEILDEEHVQKM